MPQRRLFIPLTVCLIATVLASTGEVSSGSVLCFGGSGHLQIEPAVASCCSQPVSDGRVPLETSLCRSSCCPSCTDIELGHVAAADEVLLCSTSPCVWPAVKLNGKPIGTGKPGPIFRQLLAAWSKMVGLDIRQQAMRFGDRGR